MGQVNDSDLALKKNAFLVGSVGIFIAASMIGWMLQQFLFFNRDVSWLMLAANRMLMGGTYSNDFFETNPPLILGLYLPVAFLTKILPFTMKDIFFGYMFFLSALSYFITACLANKYFSSKANLYIFLALFAFIEFILPTIDFGEREHLFVLLILPYFFCTIYRLSNQSPSKPLVFLISLLASFGFFIKPHFLLTLFLVEIFYFCRKDRKSSYLRMEVVILLGFGMIYGLIVWLFFSDYISILAYTSRLYYQGMGANWNKLFNDLTIFCLLISGFYLFIRAFYRIRTLKNNMADIFFIGLIGLLVSYLSQQTGFYYHLIPAISFSLILIILVLDDMLRFCKHRYQVILLYLLGAYLIFIPIGHSFINYQYGLADQKLIQPWVNFLKHHAQHQSVYFFSTSISNSFPLLDMSRSTSASRFPFFWMMPGLTNCLPHCKRTQKRDKSFLIEMVVSDIKRNQPHFIMIDERKRKPYIKKLNFDYLSFFLSDPVFASEWKQHYHYFKTFKYDQFKFKIYQRHS